MAMTQLYLHSLRVLAMVFGCLVIGVAAATEPVALARQAIEQGEGRKALAWLQPQANAGNVEAWYWLGRLYFYDIPGVPRDYRLASQWFERAAQAGHADARYKLGGMYYAGRGVGQSVTQALIWWRQAAKQGQAEALNNFGALLATGTGLERDEELGLALQILASRKGSGAAAENVARKGITDAARQLADSFENDPDRLRATLDRIAF